MKEKPDDFFSLVLENALGRKTRIISTSVKSGGCINNAIHLNTDAGHFFLKWNNHAPDDMFEKEAAGLELLMHSGKVNVPRPILYGNFEGKKFLLMEYLDSAGMARNYWEELGHSLALLHRENIAGKYGLDYDNYIGRLVQKNRFHENWIEFFIEERLEVQLKLALQQGEVNIQFAGRYRKFYDRLQDLLPDSPPSLLHGDLWSGNVMTGPDGKAWLIDPAVYYGHREIELSFTRMFGGFGSGFYAAYHETYPLNPGFDKRVDIYNIYPSMVHVNLFGASYLSGVEYVLRKYL